MSEHKTHRAPGSPVETRRLAPEVLERRFGKMDRRFRKIRRAMRKGVIRSSETIRQRFRAAHDLRDRLRYRLDRLRRHPDKGREAPKRGLPPEGLLRGFRAAVQSIETAADQ